MEAFEPAYEKKLAKYIKIVKNIQEMLGDIHDCDVWIEFLPEFLAGERELALEYIGHTRSVGKLRRGIESLQADRGAFRDKRYGEFVKYWEENTAVWPALLALLTKLAGKEEQPVSEV
jgi:CHAD domain-containing protein